MTTVDDTIAQAQDVLSSLGSSPTTAAVHAVREEFFALLDRIPDGRIERSFLIEGFTLLESLAS